MTHRKGAFPKYAINFLLIACFLVSIPGARADETVHPFVKSLKTIRMSYAECAAWTKELAAQHMPELGTLEFLPEDSDRVIVSKAYWRTPKFDAGGCFSQKDIIAAAVEGKTPDEYAVGCIAPEWMHALAQLLRKVDAKGYRIGANCLFRGRFRQSIAEGNKAAACWSNHGGECQTGGCGYGRAADVVYVPLDPTTPEKARWDIQEAMWLYIDTIGGPLGVERLKYFPEFMHIQAKGELESVIARNATPAIEQVAALHPDWFGGTGKRKSKLAGKYKKMKVAEVKKNMSKHRLAQSKVEKNGNGKKKKVKIARK